MSRRVIITAPPPTPNGDLHVGHLSGPFLAADVFCRFVRAKGGQTAFASYSDDNQSYVETTATRLGEAPEGHALDFSAYLNMALAVDGVLDPRRANPVNAAVPGGADT